MDLVPRVRMIAGPNGSGKSTVRRKVLEQLIVRFVNADEIEKSLRSGVLNLDEFDIQSTATEWKRHVQESIGLHSRAFPDGDMDSVVLESNRLEIRAAEVNAYLATLVADFIRSKLIDARLSFSFETVMSSRDKIDVLKRANASGYRTYLYFVTTGDPEVNVARVAERVAAGGHNVPTEKIRSRYFKSMDNLFDAVRETDRAFIFDNSGGEAVCFAEIVGGMDVRYLNDLIPPWFVKYVLDKRKR